VLGSGAELAKQQRELEQFKGALVSARSSEGAQSMVAQVRLQNLDEREQGLSVQMRAHPYACKCSVCTVRRRPPATRPLVPSARAGWLPAGRVGGGPLTRAGRGRSARTRRGCARRRRRWSSSATSTRSQRASPRPARPAAGPAGPAARGAGRARRGGRRGMFAEQTAVELRAERGEAVQHPNVVPVGEDRAILRPQQRMPFKCR
jgi:hypothetical protein